MEYKERGKDKYNCVGWGLFRIKVFQEAVNRYGPSKEI
jgi:hypothetical protein